MTTITNAQYAVLSDLLVNNDRVAFYLKLHEFTGSRTALMMSQVSSSSGLIGGAAWHINNVYDLVISGYPEIGVEEFSIAISEREFADFKPLPDGAGYPVPSDTEMLMSASAVWTEMGLPEYFPGNILILTNAITDGDLGRIAKYLPYVAQSISLIAYVGASDMIWEYYGSTLNTGKSIQDFLDLNPGSYTVPYAGGRVVAVVGSDNRTIGAFSDKLMDAVPLEILQTVRQLISPIYNGTVDVLNSLGSSFPGPQAFFTFSVEARQSLLLEFLPQILAAAPDLLYSLTENPVFGALATGLIAAQLAVQEESRLPATYLKDKALMLIGVEIGEDSLASYGNVNRERFEDGLTGKSFIFQGAGILSDFVGFAGGVETNLSGGLSSDDRLYGSAHDNLLEGGAGRDILAGFGGDDRLQGGGDDDILMGGRGSDVLDGGGGSDFLIGGEGADWLGYSVRGLGG